MGLEGFLGSFKQKVFFKGEFLEELVIRGYFQTISYFDNFILIADQFSRQTPIKNSPNHTKLPVKIVTFCFNLYIFVL